MTQITVGSVIAPIIIEIKILTVVPVPPITNKVITTVNKEFDMVLISLRLTNPLFPSTSHLLLYVVITVQAVGMAIILRITAIKSSKDFKVPEVSIAPIALRLQRR